MYAETTYDVPMSSLALKDERMALRLTGHQKTLIEEAARARGESLTEFSVTAIIHRAEEVLADQRYFLLGDADWEAFNEALDHPARVLPGLRDLMHRPSVFE
jgi:uncharacterized protein (DUF1778 family)